MTHSAVDAGTAKPIPCAAAIIAARPELKLELDKTLTLGTGADIADLVAALVHSGIKVRAVEPMKQSLEEIYLELVRRPEPAAPN